MCIPTLVAGLVLGLTPGLNSLDLGSTLRPVLAVQSAMSEVNRTNGLDSNKLREIDASIAEGKLMLQVLRSLPKSEVNFLFLIVPE